MSPDIGQYNISSKVMVNTRSCYDGKKVAKLLRINAGDIFLILRGLTGAIK